MPLECHRGWSLSDKIIRLEELSTLDAKALGQLMRLVPGDQLSDPRIKRFLAFRLKLDGLVATQVYLVNALMAAEKAAYRGLLFDFLCRDHSKIDTS